MEQVVATAARAALNVKAYGIVDQNVSVAPPGVTFMSACNDDWKKVAQRLIRRAHSIVLILPPGQDVREGFAWEIEQIARYRRQSRVIMVLPPRDQDPRGHRHALGQVDVLLTMLESKPGSAREGEGFSRSTIVVKCTENVGIRRWDLQDDERPRPRFLRWSPKSVVADATYVSGLVEAFTATEHELSDRSFDARYA
jgi:hypothetical protein